MRWYSKSQHGKLYASYLLIVDEPDLKLHAIPASAKGQLWDSMFSRTPFSGIFNFLSHFCNIWMIMTKGLMLPVQSANKIK